MKKYEMETIVGIFVLVGILAMGYMTVKLGDLTIFGDRGYHLYARFTSVTGLRVGSAVYIAGIRVGQVEELAYDQKTHKALVKLSIKSGIEVYDDAIASIRTEGLIGDMHLRLDPGGGGELLAEGGVIIETHPPLDIADLVSRYAFGEVKKKDQ
jgi:phospholipid/cholesterol/gamma-HCH transport system substrate-binding protein